jgi:hypothetical protein
VRNGFLWLLSSDLLGSHSSVAQRREDRVFRLLQNERNLCKAIPLRNANRIGRPGSQERRAAVAAVAERELTFEELLETREGATAVARTDALLEELGSTREEWQPNSAVYQRSQRRVCLSRLQQLQTEIVKTVTERRVELEVLHRRVRGQAMARRFLGLINSRWKPLDKLVADYNLEVERYNQRVDPEGPVRLRPLSHRQLREIGIDDADGEVWDVERLLCNEDWGVHDYVRHGIDARYRQKRAAEENKYLSLHVDRIVRWLSQQTAVLLQALALDIPASKKMVQIQLLHRQKVALSFLKAAKKRKNQYFWSAAQHRQLQEVHDGIAAALDMPLRQLEYDADEMEAVDGDNDEGDEGGDNASENGNLQEEVADRLMHIFEREVELDRDPEDNTDDEWVDEGPGLELYL